MNNSRIRLVASWLVTINALVVVSCCEAAGRISDGTKSSGGVTQLNGDSPVIAAQRSLGDDYFLAPKPNTQANGKAALHLDVPYGARVRVLVQPSAEERASLRTAKMSVRATEVRGRQRYRSLLLDLPKQRRTDVRVKASLPSVVGAHGTREIAKTITMMAGDRNHLAFRENEFSQIAQTAPVALILAQTSTSNTTTAKSAAAPCYDIAFDPDHFKRGSTASEIQLLAIVEYGGSRGTAKSIEFAKDTPEEFKLIFPNMDASYGNLDVAMKFELSWDKKKLGSSTNETYSQQHSISERAPETFQFTFNPRDRNGIGLMNFSGAPTKPATKNLRTWLEEELTKVLSKTDSPKVVNAKCYLQWVIEPEQPGTKGSPAMPEKLAPAIEVINQLRIHLERKK